jgi:hypothetical protein
MTTEKLDANKFVDAYDRFINKNELNTEDRQMLKKYARILQENVPKYLFKGSSLEDILTRKYIICA